MIDDSNSNSNKDYVHQLEKPWNIQDFLYPPQLPPELQLLRKENIAIPACYLLVGILQGLSGPLLNVYPLDLNATEAQQTTISTLKSLPASLKLIFGFISDNFPILGYRRKSYMLIGWCLAALSYGSLLLTTDLTLSEETYEKDDGSIGTNTIAPFGAPSIPFLCLTTFLYGSGFWLADVMGDSVVAEKARLEPTFAKGITQSSCYSYRFFGYMVAGPVSTGLYKYFGPKVVIFLLSALPFSILPLVCTLGEVRYGQVASTKDQCKEIWNTVCSRAVWQPLAFVYIYNVLQVGNSAWNQYLKTTLEFTSTQINLIYIASSVLLYVGVMTYKHYMINWSWRFVYIVCTILSVIFSAMQVLLIKGITFGLPNFAFALGDDAFSEFLAGVQFLPTTIMMVNLCPVGSEGASYAMFTTINNSAGQVSRAISTQLLRIWDVSKDTLAKHELQGMVNLTILTTGLQLCGILFVRMLPRTKDELFELREKEFGSSKIGGLIFLIITFASILYTMTISILNVVAPGWSGES
ncbi:MFS general substrate transporter [Fragilariopsis cylindrus CCMP1102]|uniref:MFS general substrate transporter n=1 Tax=Fragilariopsis cylindrus CCMP1102 TaxID=635003 RepID=A0A1E7F4I7_9STRA|nr:MFS general substrate transporter [Fragilariopsis cylindrus CCMP1102]|eukprot:OEU13046.1 MFS general substrate transporter [Fragilariopsis cylindrus CCMP1102]